MVRWQDKVCTAVGLDEFAEIEEQARGKMQKEWEALQDQFAETAGSSARSLEKAFEGLEKRWLEWRSNVQTLACVLVIDEGEVALAARTHGCFM